MARFWRRLGILALAAGALTWGAGLLRDSKALEENLVRLHVVANSDSQEDQDLKLQVRDAIVAQLNGVMEELDSAQEAKEFLAEHLGELEDTANRVLQPGSMKRCGLPSGKERGTTGGVWYSPPCVSPLPQRASRKRQRPPVSPASWPEPSLGRKGNTKFVFSSWIGWGRSKTGFIRDFRLPKAVCSQDAFPGNQTLQGICTNAEMR